MKTDNDLLNSWMNFVSDFANESIIQEKKVVPAGESNFRIENFLNTGIELNNSYGFLTVDFRAYNCKWNVQDFISATQIHYQESIFEKFKLQSTQWSMDEFPCRIFGADKKDKLRFYRNENIEKLEDVFNSYLIVFQNVVLTIIKLKTKDVAFS